METQLHTRTNYSGILGKRQIEGNSYNGKKYQIMIHHSLNNYQTFLVNRALFGLKVYSEEEIIAMDWKVKKKIIYKQKRAHKSINILKQEVINLFTNSFFKKFFPKAVVTQQLEKIVDTDETYNCNLKFKSLGITPLQIVDRLISEKILPPNFYQLNLD